MTRKKFKFNVQAEIPANSGNFQLVELEGTLIAIPTYDGFYFVYHKYPGLKGNCISELLTGGRLTYGAKNKTEAVQNAKLMLDSSIGGDHEKLRRRMRYIKDNKIQVTGWKGRYLNDKPQGRLL